MLTLCVISIDRYVAVCFPLRYTAIVTHSKIFATLSCTWLQGLTFGSAPAVMGWVRYDYWEVICTTDWLTYGQPTTIYVLWTFICCFLLPSCVTICAYAVIIYTICSKSLSSDPLTPFKGIGKTIGSLTILIIAFVVCLTPFAVTKLLKSLYMPEPDYVPGYANLTASCSGYISAMINPFIYAIFRKDFRDEYKRIMHKCLCKHSNVAQNNQVLPVG